MLGFSMPATGLNIHHVNIFVVIMALVAAIAHIIDIVVLAFIAVIITLPVLLFLLSSFLISLSVPFSVNNQV